MADRIIEWKDGVGKRVYQDATYRWVIQWRDRDGQVRQETLAAGHTRRSAKSERAGRVREANRGVAPGVTTLADFLPEWDRSIDKRLRAQTVNGYRSLVRTHIKPAFGQLRLRDVRPSVVQAELDRGALAKLSPAMQRKVVGCLSVIMAAAALRDKADPVTFSMLELEPRVSREIRPLDLDELQRLAAAFTPWYRPDVLWLGITGVRRGEHSALLADDVDLDARTARIYRTLDRFGSFGATKTTKSKRTVELFAGAVEAVRAKRELRLAAGIPHADLLWTTKSGRPISWPNFHRDHWSKAIETANLPGLRLHDLRHTAATLMISAGLDVGFVSRQLGHANVTTTMNVYAHWLEQRNQTMVDRFDEAYSVKR